LANGLSGLAAAVYLPSRRKVLILESSERGGRIKQIQKTVSFCRGFQVLLTAYPETSFTRLQSFESQNARHCTLRQGSTDPFRRPSATLIIIAP
jgi:phytoene dehydrogenase-like protein